jgi:hypothetical protein
MGFAIDAGPSPSPSSPGSSTRAPNHYYAAIEKTKRNSDDRQADDRGAPGRAVDVRADRAHSMSSDGTTLTLNEVTPIHALFFRSAETRRGHMTTTDFVALWAEGDNSFQEDPPNAVLAFLEPGDEAPEDAVVVIEQPRLENGHLSYSIATLEGIVPAQTGAGYAVYRPVRTATLASFGVRSSPARAAARAAAVLTPAEGHGPYRACARSNTPSWLTPFAPGTTPISPPRLVAQARRRPRGRRTTAHRPQAVLAKARSGHRATPDLTIHRVRKRQRRGPAKAVVGVLSDPPILVFSLSIGEGLMTISMPGRFRLAAPRGPRRRIGMAMGLLEQSRLASCPRPGRTKSTPLPRRRIAVWRLKWPPRVARARRDGRDGSCANGRPRDVGHRCERWRALERERGAAF